MKKKSAFSFQLSALSYGFTLIELLVVIAIIGILLAISIFGLQGARANSRDAKRKSDFEAIRSALEMYKADYGYYPLRESEEAGWEISNDGDWLQNLPSQYLPNAIVDPINDTTYYYRYAKCDSDDTSLDSVGGQKGYKLLFHSETTMSTKTCPACNYWTGGSGYECVSNP